MGHDNSLMENGFGEDWGDEKVMRKYF